MGTDLFIFKGAGADTFKGAGADMFKGAGADMFGYVCIKHIGPGTFKNK
jgi:hypothetical protein